MTTSLDVPAGFTATDLVSVRQLMITVPGASNAFGPTQLVHLQGRVTFVTQMTNSIVGCPCEFTTLIRDTAVNSVSVEQFQTFSSITGANLGYSFDVEALFAAPPGPRLYQLEVRLSYRNNSATAASFGLSSSSSLSAMSFPFGPAGTSALSADRALNVAAEDDQPGRRRDE